MDRRSFIRITMAGAATGLVMPQTVFADTVSQKLSADRMAGGVYYTKDAPGRWSKKAGAHAPIIEKTTSGVRVVTGHPMKPNEHWIVKHMLLDQDFRFLQENIFDPDKDRAAISNFALPAGAGVVYALSVCNLHDTWLTALEV